MLYCVGEYSILLPRLQHGSEPLRNCSTVLPFLFSLSACSRRVAAIFHFLLISIARL